MTDDTENANEPSPDRATEGVAHANKMRAEILAIRDEMYERIARLPERSAAPPQSSTGLTGFLLARIAEEEAEARRMQKYGALEVASYRDANGKLRKAPVCVGFHDPARVLAECEAKKWVVEWAHMEPHDEQVLHFLALPYVAHPHYREEWRP